MGSAEMMFFGEGIWKYLEGELAWVAITKPA